MKVEEVPQDGEYLDKTNLREVCYALDEEGNYRQVLSVGWQAKNDALSLTWEHILEEAEAIRQEVLAGKKSPLAYHMKRRLLNVKTLAAYAGVPKRTVRKHLHAAAFLQLEASVLQKYAGAMSITVAELKEV
jgi:Fic family protein